MSKKKIKVKVKKRKLNIKRILIALLILLLVALLAYYFSQIRIKNIYIIGNKILSEKEIIELAEIGDYPKILTTSTSGITKKIKKNVYIKEVDVVKNLNGKIYIYIFEKKILCTYDNKLMLEDYSMVERHRFVLEEFDAAYTLPIPQEVIEFNVGMPNIERPVRNHTVVPIE